MDLQYGELKRRVGRLSSGKLAIYFARLTAVCVIVRKGDQKIGVGVL